MEVPFLRFSLEQPPHAPPSELARDVETWARFWDPLEPLMEKVKSKDKLLRYGASAALSLTFIVLSCVVVLVATKESSDSVLLIGLISCALMSTTVLALAAVSGRVKLAHLMQFQEYCKAHESMFPNHHLECRLLGLLNQNTRGGYYLYFVPVDDSMEGTNITKSDNEMEQRNGYSRIKITQERFVCGKYQRFAQFVSDDNYLPAGLESIQVQDWNDFWSKLDKNSKDCASSVDKHRITSSVCWGTVIVTWLWAWDNLALNLVVLCLMLGSAIAMCYYNNESAVVAREQSNLIKEYVGIFRSQRVYMESCRMTTAHPFFGGLGHHYLYFYRVRGEE